MAIEKRAGSKVNLHKIKSMAVATADYIDSWSKDGKGKSTINPELALFKRPVRSAHTPSVKDKFYMRLATTIKNKLHDDKRKSKKSRIALSTYTSYLGDVRKHLQRELNLRSLSLNQDIKTLKAKHGNHSKIFEKVERASAENIVAVKALALDALENIDSIEAEDAYNDLRTLKVNHILVRQLAPTASQSSRRKKSITDNRTARKNNATTISFAQINAIMNECLESDNFYEMAVGIALATGRRAIECIHVGTFEKSKKQNDIKFSGVAKKAVTSARGTKHTIPLLIPSEKIISTVEKLRSTKRYLSLFDDVSSLPLNEQNIVINRRAAGGLNGAMRTLFSIDTLTFKDSRTIAGHVAVEKMHKVQARYEKIDVGAFRTQYFIHETNEAAVNYEHIKIDFNSSYSAEKNKQAHSVNKSNKADTSALEAITTDLKKLPKKYNGGNMRPVINLHEKVIKILKDNGAFALSASVIYKGKKQGDSVIKIGGGKPVIKRYLDNSIVKKAISKYHKANGLKTRG